MKFARYEVEGNVYHGIAEDKVVTDITASPVDDYQVTERVRSLSEVRLLAPILPGKLIAIGLNYRSHLSGDREAPSVPEPFFKTPSSLVGPKDDIVLPRESSNVQEEAELTVVMGRRCKGATKENALEYVFGYTCGNDVSERNWQKDDLQWWRAKSSDTFTPLGPFIVTGLNPANLDLEARINGETVQKSNTSYLLHNVPTIIEWISKVITLEPGDVILTGTPGEPKNLHAGDVVEVEVEGIGVLTNTVRAE